MRAYQSRDGKRARTQDEKLWYAAGIPYRFWHDPLGHIRFKLIKYEEELTTPEVQEAAYEKLFESKSWRQPNLIAIGSVPTDKEATMLAIRIAKSLLKAGALITLQDMGYDNITETNDDAIVYFGYNILDELTIQRRQRIRDWLSWHDDKLRILVVAGDPLRFMLDTLRFEPNAVVFVDSSKQIKLSLV